MKTRNNNESGFTIIEVLIVLAIAALILVVVLVAIPQLQRNQRNQARQAMTGRVVSEINNYAGNNNGRIPDDQASLNDVRTRYLGCESEEEEETCTVNIEDPQSGDNMSLTYTNEASVGSVPDGQVGQLRYRDERTCDGETLEQGQGRQFALWTELEGGAIYCLDNG